MKRLFVLFALLFVVTCANAQVIIPPPVVDPFADIRNQWNGLAAPAVPPSNGIAASALFATTTTAIDAVEADKALLFADLAVVFTAQERISERWHNYCQSITGDTVAVFAAVIFGVTNPYAAILRQAGDGALDAAQALGAPWQDYNHADEELNMDWDLVAAYCQLTAFDLAAVPPIIASARTKMNDSDACAQRVSAFLAAKGF